MRFIFDNQMVELIYDSFEVLTVNVTAFVFRLAVVISKNSHKNYESHNITYIETDC